MVVLTLGNTKISLHQKLKVKVNRRRVRLPYSNHAEFSVIRDGQSVKVMTSLGIKLIWDGDSFVEVTVPSRYKGHVQGLCGNYNGVGTDDLIGRDKKLYFEGEAFGDTWRVGSKSACVINDAIHSSESPCKDNQERRKRSRKECSHLLSNFFSECRRKLDVMDYYRYVL